MKSSFAQLVACWLACSSAVAAPPDRYPGLAAAYLVQAEGTDLWAGNADARLPPASLTKIMAALVVLEDYRPDDVVVVSANAARAGGTRMKLAAGDKLTVASLFTGMLMASANDACTALAEHVSGSVRNFVGRMNDRVAGLGLSNTHFANPCGFDESGHFSSARDLASLAHEAMRYPQFATVVSRTEARVATLSGHRNWLLKNRNALIGTYKPAIGIKTGYTGKAGRCLIALADRDGKQVLVVMLNAKSRWWDTIGLIEKAFEAGNGAR